MKLAVFGGTGPTGQLLIARALERGNTVTAYARTPSKLEPRPGLEVIAGELEDTEGIARTIRGSGAVVSLLGPSTRKKDGPPIVTGTRHIIQAMRDERVARLVAIATPSFRVPEDGTDLRIAAIVAGIKLLQRTGYNTIIATADAIVHSELDWTLVRVPMLTNKPAAGKASARHIGEPGALSISRGNIAAFILDELDRPDWVHEAPLISDPRN